MGSRTSALDQVTPGLLSSTYLAQPGFPSGRWEELGSSPVLLIGLPLGGGIEKGQYKVRVRNSKPTLNSGPWTPRPQESGSSSPGPEAAPQSVPDRHPLLP